MNKYRIGIMIFIIVAAGFNLLRPKTGFEKWVQCGQDIDCVAVKEVCGEGMCVNSRYLPEAQAFADAVDPSRCPPGAQSPQLPCACVKKRCQCQPAVKE